MAPLIHSCTVDIWVDQFDSAIVSLKFRLFGGDIFWNFEIPTSLKLYLKLFKKYVKIFEYVF